MLCNQINPRLLLFPAADLRWWKKRLRGLFFFLSAYRIYENSDRTVASAEKGDDYGIRPVIYVQG